MMKNVPIPLKVSLGFAVIIAMFVVVLVTNKQNITHLSDNAEWVSHSQQVLSEIEHVLSLVKDGEVGERGYAITGDEAYLAPYKEAQADVYEHLDDLIVLVDDNPSQQQLARHLRVLIQRKFDLLEEAVVLRHDMGFDAIKDHMKANEGKQVMDNIRAEIQKMMLVEERLLEERHLFLLNQMSRSTRINVLMLILAIGVVIGILFLINYLVVGPINRLNAKALMISKGDLSNEFNKDNRRDEIGRLAFAFKVMQASLIKRAKQAGQIAQGDLSLNIEPLSDQDTLGIAFKAMVEQFHEQMMQIKEGVNVLSSSSNEMMAVMSQLATGASETATSVSETTSTVEEIKQTAEVANQKSTEVSDSSKELVAVSKQGNESVQKSIDGMLNIKQQMESIAAIVIQLSERSHKIGEIANTVNDIAEQSNLLAVNASIEASKAGEYGKGFAVVAQEIKNLATRSKDSTVEIRSILSDIQKEISSAVLATEQGGKVIEDGMQQSNKARDIISLLSDNTENASQANLLIAATTQQQLVGMDQIATAMESIKEASVQNSNSTKQVELSVSELKDLGNKLIKLAARYKLN